MKLAVTCEECGRDFDLLDPDDAAEWSAGHDCEPPAVKRVTHTSWCADHRHGHYSPCRDPHITNKPE